MIVNNVIIQETLLEIVSGNKDWHADEAAVNKIFALLELQSVHIHGADELGFLMGKLGI